MMMTAHTAVMAAKTVLPGTAEHAVACELCQLRGFEPDDPITSLQGIPPCSNWQWIMAEQILEQQLRIMLARSSKMAMQLNG